MLKQPTIMLWVYTGPEHCSSHFSIFSSSAEAYATLTDRTITRAHAILHATGEYASAAGLAESFRSSRGSSKGSSASTRTTLLLEQPLAKTTLFTAGATLSSQR